MNRMFDLAARPFHEPVVIEPLTGIVRIGGAPVSIPARERELTVAIAVQTRPISAAGLCDLLYPERETFEARNALKVYVHRLRRRFTPDFIVRFDGGYTLGPGVR